MCTPNVVPRRVSKCTLIPCRISRPASSFALLPPGQGNRGRGLRPNPFFTIPPTLSVAVSDDGEEYRLVRRVETGGRRQLFRTTIRADDPRTRGRYALVRLNALGVYAFCDEIEVLRGGHDPREIELPDGRIARLDVEPKPTGLQKRLLRDLDALERRVGAAADALREEVAQARSLIDRIDATDRDTVASLEGAVRGLQRKAAQRLFPERRLAVWGVSPWAQVSPGDVPPKADRLRELRVTAGQNEYEPAAFMLINLSSEARTVLETRVSGVTCQRATGTTEQQPGLNFARPQSWVPTKLGHNPHQDVEGLVGESVVCYYGEATPVTKTFLAELESLREGDGGNDVPLCGPASALCRSVDRRIGGTDLAGTHPGSGAAVHRELLRHAGS